MYDWFCFVCVFWENSQKPLLVLPLKSVSLGKCPQKDVMAEKNIVIWLKGCWGRWGGGFMGKGKPSFLRGPWNGKLKKMKREREK